jgi:RNA polymerase sigma-70 factor (ECF subfamily)
MPRLGPTPSGGAQASINNFALFVSADRAEIHCPLENPGPLGLPLPSVASDAKAVGALVLFATPFYAELVEKHYRSVYLFARQLCRNQADAEDVTQETFRRLVVRGHQIRDAGAAKTWLFTTARRVAADIRRFSWRWTSDEDLDGIHEQDMFLRVVSPTAPDRADIEAIQHGIASMPEKLCAALTLFYLNDCSYDEIATVLGVPVGTVMSRLHRGRQLLATRLGVTLHSE